jgi:hypothetical protein
MNLVECYIEKYKGLPVTHKVYPRSKEIENATLILIRFSNPNNNLYYIAKNRYGMSGAVLSEDLALYSISTVHGKYILIDSSILPRTEYFSVRSKVIKFLNPEPCGDPKPKEWW